MMKIASIKDDVLYVDELIEGGTTSFSENGLITGELIEGDTGVSFTEGSVYVKELVEGNLT